MPLCGELPSLEWLPCVSRTLLSSPIPPPDQIRRARAKVGMLLRTPSTTILRILLVVHTKLGRFAERHARNAVMYSASLHAARVEQLKLAILYKPFLKLAKNSVQGTSSDVFSKGGFLLRAGRRFNAGSVRRLKATTKKSLSFSASDPNKIHVRPNA